MASFHVWLEVLSWTKALFEATTLGVDLRNAYEQHRQEKDTISEAKRVSETVSTYSEEEVEALLNRLKQCRDRFIQEGSGPSRAKCLCSVFADAMAGNGGQLPDIDDWQKFYRQLNCPKMAV